MNQEYFIVAGKTEGFSYKDAAIHRVCSAKGVEIALKHLRNDGFTIFYVSRVIERIDDNVIEEE
ncbi:hypothetical protein [Bacillus velezensis]|uniref:hypothetical protein n=1 Tax=Bacillus velezensis TaxID=492670 RepID=UPI002DBA167C|nr:hypothetical protein [Bacillus velezensis]MEC2215075.1 hypothetical protein [Bacillus velezensis]